ncbi:hypothetical protein DF186_25955, partial [Enterococcus hirae]
HAVAGAVEAEPLAGPAADAGCQRPGDAHADEEADRLHGDQRGLARAPGALVEGQHAGEQDQRGGVRQQRAGHEHVR